MHKTRALVGLSIALASALFDRRATAEPPRPGAPAARSSDVEGLFQAKRRLESMGIRDLSGVVAAEVAGSTAPTGASAAGSSDRYRGRMVASTLAFRHGLCDEAGGLPKYGDDVALTIRNGGSIELRATMLGQLLDASERPLRIWVCDPSKLPDGVQLRRSSALHPR